jgi:hypothetical protein
MSRYKFWRFLDLGFTYGKKHLKIYHVITVLVKNGKNLPYSRQHSKKITKEIAEIKYITALEIFGKQDFNPVSALEIYYN